MANLDEVLPPWLQAAITIAAAAGVFIAALWGKIRDPSATGNTVISRQEFMELFARETEKQRGVLIDNRDVLSTNMSLLTAIKENTSSVAATNQEILRVMQAQLSAAHDSELADKVLARMRSAAEAKIQRMVRPPLQDEDPN